MPQSLSATIWIVFPVFNRIESTIEFLSTLDAQTNRNFRVVICDDGSTDGTSEHLRRERPDVIVVEGTGSLWWTAGINRSIRRVLELCAPDDYVLTINNDVALASDYLEQKARRAAEYPGAIIGSLCVYKDSHNLIETSGFVMDFEGCISRSLTKTSEQRTARHTGMWRATHLPGKGVLIPVEVFRRLGLYDEERFPHYHADTDYILSAHEAGVPVYVDFDSCVYSDVNLNNMTLETQKIRLRDILKTYRGPYSINNCQIYRRFAYKHFPRSPIRYLVNTYSKIVLGQLKRYFFQFFRP